MITAAAAETNLGFTAGDGDQDDEGDEGEGEIHIAEAGSGHRVGTGSGVTGDPRSVPRVSGICSGLESRRFLTFYH